MESGMEKNSSESFVKSQEDGRDEELAKWEIGVLTCILIITILGNSLVLFSLYVRRHRARKKMTRMYFFIMHLSIADLLSGLLDVLPQLVWDITYRFQGGPVLCKIVKFLQPIGPYLSSYVLIATAIDRYHAICHPLTYCSTTNKRPRIMVYSAWIIAIVLCIPQVFIFSYQEIMPQVWDCWASFELPYMERVYVTWYSITVFFIPFIVLVYTYTCICVDISRTSKISSIVELKLYKNSSNFPRQSNHISRAMINTVRQTIAVISLYIITSTPFTGCLLWASWDPEASSSQFFKGPAFTILTLLSSLTSCVNPWIYLSFNRELRSALMNGLFKKEDYSLTYGNQDP